MLKNCFKEFFSKHERDWPDFRLRSTSNPSSSQLVSRHGNGQRLRFFAHKTFARFGAQIQLQLAVNPIHPLVIPAIALHVEQV